MSNTTNTTMNDPMTIEPEGSMFAPVPAWERARKRRGFGSRASRVAAETRSFAPERPTTLSDRDAAQDDRVDDSILSDTGFAGTPVYATRTARKGNGAAPIALAAGVILVGGVALAGWYGSRPHNQGIPELTPGSTNTTTTASATGLTTSSSAAVSEQTAAPTQVAQNAPAPAVRTHTVITTTRGPAPVSHTTVTRMTHMTPASRAVTHNSSNVSSTAAIPAPASSAAPPAAAAPPAPLVLNIPQTAPAQSPLETPVTPQTTPLPPPTQTPPTT